MLRIEDRQIIATPVPHRLHPRPRLLNVEPKLTHGRGDFEQLGVRQGLDDADYKTCVGPAESSCIVCALTGTHFGDILVQLILGHIHRSQVYDTDNRRIRGELNIIGKVGIPWHPGTGRIVVADLVEVYGGIAIRVEMFHGYQCPMCVGVFVLGASEECDSDVNTRPRLSGTRILRVHINWMKGERGMRGGEEESNARETHGTGGHNRRVRVEKCDLQSRSVDLPRGPNAISVVKPDFVFTFFFILRVV